MNRERARRGFGLISLGAILALSITACAPEPPDPEETVESLSSVAESPSQPDAAEEYDVETRPEPIAEPLECTPYLVVTARGTKEPKQKKQLLSPVVRAITKAFPDLVQYADLDYPADTDVNEGGTYGVRLLTDTLNVQSDTCPDQRFVLLGYSQGALIIGDTLAAPDTRLVGATVGRLSQESADRIVAIVLYGNPRFSGAEPYASGSFDEDLGGILPRQPDSLDEFADRIADFCVKDDFICQSSMDLNEEGHVAYYKNGMQREGAEFVIDLIQERVSSQAAPEEEVEPEAETEAD